MILKCMPKGSQREPKGAKREPNGSQRVPRDAKGAQREPKDDENASKDRSRSDVRKMSPKSKEKGPQNGPVWDPFSIKNRCKKQCKKRCPKNMEIHEIATKKHPEIEAEMYRKAGFLCTAHFRKTTIIDGVFAKKQGLPSREPCRRRKKNMKNPC